MGFESEFREFMTQTVVIAPQTGLDSYGKPTFGTGVARQCRIEYRPRMNNALRGRTELAIAKIYLDGDYSTEETARVTLPDGTVSPLIVVERHPDETGDHHEVLWVGRGRLSG